MLGLLPLVRYPFSLRDLPENGIYFFYEDGENADHGGVRQPRIVRVGTHRDGNLQSRINDHYLLENESKYMDFSVDKRAPKDRSIFRKHLGRALLSRDKSPYRELWEIDFTKKDNQCRYRETRDITIERKYEQQITEILRTSFGFRCIPIDEERLRVGVGGLESKIIGTLAACRSCSPSRKWLGQYHPDIKINKSGLWQVQHLSAPGLDDHDCGFLESLLTDN